MSTMVKRRQRTLARDAEVRGVGYLTGADVRLRFRPAQEDAGLVFVRVDLPDKPRVPAHVRHVVPRQRRTALQQGEASVEMVEHVLAALAGLRIDNCMIEIDAAETPGLDGSSRGFVEALTQAGAVEQEKPRAVLAIDRAVTVGDGQGTLMAHPGTGSGLLLSYNLDYGRSGPIGRQSYFADITPETFEAELAPCRTFLLEPEALALRQAGIGARTTEADLLVFGPDGPIKNELRYPDECARHKVLDLVGDLALAGCDLVGHVVAHRSGHQLNAELVRKLLDDACQGDGACRNDGRQSPADLALLDIGAITKILPHRYPFLMIDRVTELEPNDRLVALKNVTCNEPFFVGHWPGRPVMPGVLILEALAQAAGILIAQRFDPEHLVAMIVGIDAVKVRRPVVPGDQLRLEIDQFRTKLNLVDVSGVARVDGQMAAEAKIRFMVVERGG